MYVVLHDNSSDEFDIAHCAIKSMWALWDQGQGACAKFNHLFFSKSIAGSSSLLRVVKFIVKDSRNIYNTSGMLWKTNLSWLGICLA